MAGDWDGDVDRRRALLRQLRDLDDDLAAGKLTEEDHRRLRRADRARGGHLAHPPPGPHGDRHAPPGR